MILLKYILIGAGSGAALIFLAKFAMARLLQRDNDYYKDEFDRFIEGGEEID